MPKEMLLRAALAANAGFSVTCGLTLLAVPAAVAGWMCFALFVASSAFFLGQAQLFPAVVRRTPALWILGFLLLVLLVYWMFRVMFTRWDRRLGHEA